MTTSTDLGAHKKLHRDKGSFDCSSCGPVQVDVVSSSVNHCQVQVDDELGKSQSQFSIHSQTSVSTFHQQHPQQSSTCHYSLTGDKTTVFKSNYNLVGD